MEILNKIQKLPETKRKIILWLIMIMLAVLLFKFYLGFYIKDFQKKLKYINKEKIRAELQIPKLEEELRKIGIPK